MSAGELTAGGRTRTFTLRLPKTVPHGRPMPLVLVLHGNMPGGGGWQMREGSTFEAQADAWGVAVAFPDGVGGCWADGRGVTAAEEAGVDDIAFLCALIDRSAERHGTAPDRTVVAGVSNGSFMAHRLALSASSQVAVLAAVSGTLPAGLRDLRPSHAVSALLMHGTADELAPIGGGYSRRRGPNGELRGRTVSLSETAEHWSAIDRCSPESTETETTSSMVRTTVSGGVGGTRVVSCALIGGGHGWPGWSAVPGTPAPAASFDPAEEICRFAEPLYLPSDVRSLSP